MKDVMFDTKGVCARQIFFQLDEEGKIHNLQFNGGCNGNLKAIGKLCEGQDAKVVAGILRGNTCGFKKTSCTDQLAIAIEENL